MAQGKKHQVTEQSRRTVELLKGMGQINEHIAYVMGCTVKTLTKHYKKELEFAKGKIDAVAYKGLFNKVQQGDLTAIIFYLKTRCNWRERIDLEGSHKVELPRLVGEVIPKASE